MYEQLKLFQTILNSVSIRTSQFDKDGVDINEAPEGFYAQIKEFKGYNICNDCDARKLCQENIDNWCIKNRCMGYEVFSKRHNRIIKRNDGKGVIFKRISETNG